MTETYSLMTVKTTEPKIDYLLYNFATLTTWQHIRLGKLLLGFTTYYKNLQDTLLGDLVLDFAWH